MSAAQGGDSLKLVMRQSRDGETEIVDLAPPPVRLYPVDSWGPKSVHQLIAPNAWRLPFEREWRNPNPVGA